MLDWSSITEQQPMLRAIPNSLRQQATLRHAAAGTTLYHRGQPPEAILCVLDGELCLVRHTASGGETVLQRSRAGFIAEASMNAEVYHCDVVAVEESRVLRFPLPAFRRALEADPLFNHAWIAQLAQELRRVRTQCERLSLHSAAERILHYLDTEGDEGAVTLTQSRKAWARELGLSHEALYRTLRTLREKGVLAIDGAYVARCR